MKTIHIMRSMLIGLLAMCLSGSAAMAQENPATGSDGAAQGMCGTQEIVPEKCTCCCCKATGMATGTGTVVGTDTCAGTSIGAGASTEATEGSPTPSQETLGSMRGEIDHIDSLLIELLAQRMDVCLRVGRYKKAAGLEAVQPARYQSLMDSHAAQGEQRGLDPSYVRQIFELIHDESVRQQKIILGTE